MVTYINNYNKIHYFTFRASATITIKPDTIVEDDEWEIGWITGCKSFEHNYLFNSCEAFGKWYIPALFLGLCLHTPRISITHKIRT